MINKTGKHLAVLTEGGKRTQITKIREERGDIIVNLTGIIRIIRRYFQKHNEAPLHTHQDNNNLKVGQCHALARMWRNRNPQAMMVRM